MSEEHDELLRAEWPQERDLDRYCELVGFDIKNFLATGGIWIDVGCGRGVALLGQTHNTSVELVGLSPVELDLNPRITQIKATIPTERDVLERYGGRSKLVSDIFGALSYCESPLEALLYEALMLKVNGALVISTRTERFGIDLEVRRKISDFLNRYLGCLVEFEEIHSTSDDTGKVVAALQIRVFSTSSPLITELDKLLELSRIEIGIPTKTRAAWTSKDGRARIWQVDFFSEG